MIIRTEDDFEVWWKLALPLLVSKPLNSVDIGKLTSNTSWVENSKLLRNMPDIHPDQTLTYDFLDVYVIMGEHDLRFGSENSESIRYHFDESRIFNIDAGHFPTLENPLDSLAIVNRIVSMDD